MGTDSDQVEKTKVGEGAFKKIFNRDVVHQYNDDDIIKKNCEFINKFIGQLEQCNLNDFDKETRKHIGDTMLAASKYFESTLNKSSLKTSSRNNICPIRITEDVQESSNPDVNSSSPDSDDSSSKSQDTCISRKQKRRSRPKFDKLDRSVLEVLADKLDKGKAPMYTKD